MDQTENSGPSTDPAADPTPIDPAPSGPVSQIEAELESIEAPALAKLNEFIYHGRLKIEAVLANADALARAHPAVAALLPIIKQVFVEQLHHFATYATEHYVDPTAPPTPPADEPAPVAPAVPVEPAPLPPVEPAPPAA